MFPCTTDPSAWHTVAVVAHALVSRRIPSYAKHCRSFCDDTLVADG